MTDTPPLTITAAGSAVRRAAFRALLERGQPVEAAAVAGAAGLTADQVSTAIEQLRSAGQIEVDSDGRIVGAGGLSLLPTVHHLTLQGRQYYTWCAEDAVGIPAALGEPTDVESACAQCHAPVRLRLEPDTPPESSVLVGFGAVDRCESIRDEFCPTINFFCDSEHFKNWKAEQANKQARAIDLREAAELGKVWWAWLQEERT